MARFAEGPYFDELAVGDRFASAPGMTLTDGIASVHQSIVGDRLRLPLDHELACEVVGKAGLAHPALIWDVAIGQSTLATQHVRANLFYRGLAFRRFPVLGDTLRTTTEVVGLRQNSRKPGRPATGLAALRVRTADQHDRRVLEFWRCAMLPLRDADRDTGHHDDLDGIGSAGGTPELDTIMAGWHLDRFRDQVQGDHFEAFEIGQTWRVVGADVVSCAPELARLTLNIAAVHHDATLSGGQRLVYGGHVIGIALAQVARAIPNIVTVTSWKSCDHVGPVHEGESLNTEVMVCGKDHWPGGGGTVALRALVTADGGGEPRPVLDWRFAVLLA